MASPPPVTDPLTIELQELRKSLETLLDIVIKIYISSWYTSISPRDRTFVHAVRNTALGLIDSIIRDLTATQQARHDASLQMREFALEIGPTILDRHIRAFKQAQEDCLINVQVEALSSGSDKAKVDKVNVTSSSPRPSRSILDQRYHFHAPHPGIVASSVHPSQSEKVGFTKTQAEHPADSEHFERPVTPQGIDESLADALSSSITGLPGRAASRDPPVSDQRSGEHPHHDNALRYEPSPQYLSALVDRILKNHLPPNDYASTTERAMITEIIANTILGNILRKCSEPWFLWRIGLNLMGTTENGKAPGEHVMSEKGDVLTGTSTTDDITVVRGKQLSSEESSVLGLTPFYGNILLQVPSMIANAGWRCLSIASKLLRQRFYPDSETETPSSPQIQPPCNAKKYVLEPWLDVLMALTSSGDSYGKQELWSVIKMTYTLSSTTADTLAEQLVDKALRTDTATKIVIKLTDILFPDGRPADSIPDPSSDEAEEMRRSLERRIYAKIPPLARLVLGMDETAQTQTIADAFDVLSNASANTTVFLTLIESGLSALLRE